MEGQRHRHSGPLLPALAVALALVTAACQDHLLGDDAYITFRYARNLASGRGLVYNPGEVVLGTSTPLFTLLLAAGYRLGLELPDLAIWISALSWAGIIIVLARASADWPMWASTPLLVLAASVSFTENLGMESALYALLCLLSLWLVGCSHTMAAAALAGLAAITRLDGGLVAAMVLAATAVRERRLPWAEAAITGLIAGPWYVYAWSHFGSPFPNSLHAKAGLARSAGFGGGDFVQGGLALLRTRLGQWPLLAAYLVTAAAGLPAALRGPASGQSAPWRPYVAWGGLYTLAYWLTGMPHFGWYYVPLVPLLAVLAIKGLPALAAACGRLRWVVAPILAVALVVVAGQMLCHSFRSSDVSAARALSYRDAGDWLAAHARPDDSVALLEIGVVGYYSDIAVVDTMGLVSPYLAERLLDWGQSLVLAVNHYWPEYVLALDATAWEAVERQSWFALAYREVAQFDHSSEGDPAARMRLYQRLPSYPARALSAWEVGAPLRPEVQLEEAGLHGLPALTPGTTVPLLLTWRCLAPLDEELLLSTSLRLASGQQTSVSPQAPPHRGGLPTTLWRPGEVITETVPVSLHPDLPAGPAELVVTLGDSSVAVGQVIVSPSASQLAALLDHHEPASFGNSTLSAIGWTVHQPSVAPGETLDVTVGWEGPDGPITVLSLFLHLADAQDRPLAQWDGPPLGTTDRAWRPQEAIAETYSLALPPSLSPGEYRLLMGLYEWDTGRRLRPQSPRALPGDALLLGTIRIGSPEAG